MSTTPTTRRPTADAVAPASREPIKDLHAMERGHPVRHFSQAGLLLSLIPFNIWCWHAGLWPLMLLSWALMAHLGHSKLIMFHEAAHGILAPSRLRNEWPGIVIGTLALVPFSLYRFVHAQHHGHIATERDLELWPFVDTTTPRWFRVLVACARLCLGYFVTPMIFAHALTAWGRMSRTTRVRIVSEYAVMAAFWAGLLTLVTIRGWWPELLVGFLIPVIIAANLEGVRTFTEHLGLMSGSILGSTRTVVDKRLVGAAMSESMLHIDHHGTHHRFAKIPFHNLPDATEHVYAGRDEDLPIFTSYLRAMADMAPALLNPRIGLQWRTQTPRDNAPPVDEDRAADVVIETRPQAREPGDAIRG